MWSYFSLVLLLHLIQSLHLTHNTFHSHTHNSRPPRLAMSIYISPRTAPHPPPIKHRYWAHPSTFSRPLREDTKSNLAKGSGTEKGIHHLFARPAPQLPLGRSNLVVQAAPEALPGLRASSRGNCEGILKSEICRFGL